LLNASNWLKGLIKTTKVAAVLAGIEGDAEIIIDSNVQLASLFPDPIRLRPFTWDVNKPDGGDEFRKFLMLVEAQIPLKNPSYLSDPDRALCCYIASGGVVGYLMALIRGAATLALYDKDEPEMIKDCHLEQYYAEWLAAERRDIPNPFTEGNKASLPKKPAASSKAVRTLSRRGKSRKGHTDKIQDVL
jgi:hypothetical protein